MSKSRVWIVVASFNEAQVVCSTIQPLLDASYEVVVVDDGSTDNTFELLSDGAAHVCRHIVNLGQGAALQTGINYALKSGAEFIVTYDADGQHSPDDVGAILEPLQSGSYDVSLGSRFKAGADAQNIPTVRAWMLRTAAVLTRLGLGMKVTDTHNGYRAFTAAAAAKLNITQNRMAHAGQILKQIRLLKLRYIEVPVNIRYTSYSLAKGQRMSNIFNILWESVIELLRR
jgi:glycosyltransferase involved in cell wall biosynthesis